MCRSTAGCVHAVYSAGLWKVQISLICGGTWTFDSDYHNGVKTQHVSTNILVWSEKTEWKRTTTYPHLLGFSVDSPFRALQKKFGLTELRVFPHFRIRKQCFHCGTGLWLSCSDIMTKSCFVRVRCSLLIRDLRRKLPSDLWLWRSCLWSRHRTVCLPCWEEWGLMSGRYKCFLLSIIFRVTHIIKLCSGGV